MTKINNLVCLFHPFFVVALAFVEFSDIIINNNNNNNKLDKQIQYCQSYS